METEASLMLFSVREFVFALEIGSLLEVALVDRERLLRDEEGRFEAMLDYRGTAIPLVRLTGREIKTLPEQFQVIVVEGEFPVGIVIDRVMEVVGQSGTCFRFPDMLRTDRNRFIRSICRFNDLMAFIVDPGLLLDTLGPDPARAL